MKSPPKKKKIKVAKVGSKKESPNPKSQKAAIPFVKSHNDKSQSNNAKTGSLASEKSAQPTKVNLKKESKSQQKDKGSKTREKSQEKLSNTKVIRQEQPTTKETTPNTE